MKIKACLAVLLLFGIVSCQDDNAKREAAMQKDLKKKEAVFSVVNQSWRFSEQPLTAQAQAVVANWAEWRLFLTELRQKPKSSIGAFQQKARTLSKKVAALNSGIPPKFAQPAIKARISALTTKIRSLDLYLNLDDIPAEKIPVLVTEINATLVSLTLQMDEIIRKEQIPMEQGESDMIRMLDTTRAIPSTPKK